LDIHFSSTFSTQNFKGFCGKTNIKINRKVGIKIKNQLGGICLLSSPPNTYSFVKEENLGSTRKFIENYLLFTCITNKILALPLWSLGWRNLSRTAEKEFLQPTHSKCMTILPCRNCTSSYESDKNVRFSVLVGILEIDKKFNK
jgi:hypothetical protein